MASIAMQPYPALLSPTSTVSIRTSNPKITLRGNLYISPLGPSSSTARSPLVTLCHGFGLVKEQYLDNWTRLFVAAGYHVLTYDQRGFGDSDGEVREDFNWQQQAEDVVDVVSVARDLKGVDPEKVFCWGVAHAGAVVAMAAAMDKRIAGIIMFLPCIDGAWDREQWGDSTYEKTSAHRYGRGPLEETLPFWPVDASDSTNVLSGDYIHRWSNTAANMAEQYGKEWSGRVTVQSFWNDFHCRPVDLYDRIAPTPLLWVMASDDVVCGPLEWTKGIFDGLKGPKDICVLEGEHLAQYFSPGFEKGVESMLKFLQKHRQDERR